MNTKSNSTPGYLYLLLAIGQSGELRMEVANPAWCVTTSESVGDAGDMCFNRITPPTTAQLLHTNLIFSLSHAVYGLIAIDTIEKLRTCLRRATSRHLRSFSLGFCVVGAKSVRLPLLSIPSTLQTH